MLEFALLHSFIYFAIEENICFNHLIMGSFCLALVNKNSRTMENPNS